MRSLNIRPSAIVAALLLAAGATPVLAADPIDPQSVYFTGEAAPPEVEAQAQRQLHGGSTLTRAEVRREFLAARRAGANMLAGEAGDTEMVIAARESYTLAQAAEAMARADAERATLALADLSNSTLPPRLEPTVDSAPQSDTSTATPYAVITESAQGEVLSVEPPASPEPSDTQPIPDSTAIKTDETSLETAPTAMKEEELPSDANPANDEQNFTTPTATPDAMPVTSETTDTSATESSAIDVD